MLNQDSRATRWCAAARSARPWCSGQARTPLMIQPSRQTFRRINSLQVRQASARVASFLRLGRTASKPAVTRAPPDSSLPADSSRLPCSRRSGSRRRLRRQHRQDPRRGRRWNDEVRQRRRDRARSNRDRMSCHAELADDRDPSRRKTLDRAKRVWQSVARFVRIARTRCGRPGGAHSRHAGIATRRAGNRRRISGWRCGARRRSRRGGRALCV